MGGDGLRQRPVPSCDAYPDWDLLATAAALVRKFAPDYLLMHPMSMDHVGQTYGADSPEYRNQAQRQDEIFGRFVHEWTERGYIVLVTADHGLNADRSHGSPLPDVRRVPLYLIRPGVQGEAATGRVLSQLQLAPTICRLLGIPIPETMRHLPIEE